MQEKGIRPDSTTYLCLLSACAKIGKFALHIGDEIVSTILGIALIVL